MISSRNAAASGRSPLLAAAETLLSVGRFDEAEALLQEQLHEAPDDPEALNALGAAALSRKDRDRALAILAAAATRHPDHAGLVVNLGVAHQTAGRLPEAVLCFERALVLRPGLAAALMSLATTRFLMGDHDAAAAVARDLLEDDPEHADALALLGLIEMTSGDRNSAEAHLTKAVALNPFDAAALRALAVCSFEAQRFEEALSWAERARLAAPLDLDAMEHVARCHAALGRYAESEAMCRRILAVAPNHLGANEVQARVQVVTGRTEAAVAGLTRLVRASPKDPAPVATLAATLRFAGRLSDARHFADHATRLAPSHEAARALLLDLDLALGRFAPAEPGVGPADYALLVPERLSAADLVLFARYLPLLDGDAVRVVAPDHARPLLSAVAKPVLYEEPSADTRAVALPSLAAMFGYDPSALAVQPPYIAPRPGARERWRRALSEFPAPRIGVCWNGGSSGLSMAEVRRVLPTGATAISVTTGSERHALRDWPEAVDAGVAFGGFDDMIAAIAELDLVIGPNVSALHVAGALGRPGIVLVTAGYPWYWLASEGRSRWYPSIEVLVQERPGDWSAPLDALADRLRRIISGPVDPSA